MGPASSRVPRESEKAGFYWPCGADGRYAVPTAPWLAQASPEMKEKARKLAQSPVDWEEDWPVFGISWEDAIAYAAWLSRRLGRVAGLAHDVMWEKSARGPDGRFYAFGNQFDDTFANTFRSHDGPPRPCVVDSFPHDESPYGMRGTCGNGSQWCVNDVENGRRRLLRGGSWIYFGLFVRAASRQAPAPRGVFEPYSFRTVVLPRLA